ncbi:DoxX family membrane protein [Celeribacter neptunius]|uniref:Putative oxidoreductase n=1 Tax=Celeribacter neptunius TaxID=588602 RepID=A0A1I3IWA8_9RHOB|nr:DoxX family membrane protein [Celeribacter neptunius]SFI52207.1 putative oxidoreductase [Celeribacter neptunius]
MRPIDRIPPLLLPLLARFIFAAVLLRYFWSSALTKFDGPLMPSLNGYAQIFPRQMEALGYDVSSLGPFHWAVVMAGGLAELLLPLLIVLGLATRLAALGMTGFVLVQSLTDVIGHGAMGATLGRWFDPASDALILDQRALWALLFLILIGLGGGALSFDQVIRNRFEARQAGAA